MDTTITVTGGTLPQQEIDAYVEHLRRQIPRTQVFCRSISSSTADMSTSLAAGTGAF